MSAPIPVTSGSAPARFGLLPRLALSTGVLAAETFWISGFIQNADLDALTGGARDLHIFQHWFFRYLIAYAASLSILVYLRGATGIAAQSTGPSSLIRGPWLLLHGILLALLSVLSPRLYDGGPNFFLPSAIAWHVCALAAVVTLLVTMAPWTSWLKIWRLTGTLRIYALLPAAGALLAYQASQLMWAPAADITFHFVELLLRPLIPSLQTHASSLTLLTDAFEVRISEVCSGLEGMGLMLTFCSAWLWFFRREYVFPRAFVIIAIGVILAFLLNGVRIAALVLIGNAGYPHIAAVGFHSQAGWIAFNLAAFSVAFGSKHWPWLRNNAADPATEMASSSATTAYLLPLLSILAAGMVARAFSPGFDFFYCLRFGCALAVLWTFRRAYRSLDWSFSWRGICAGIVVFGLWLASARMLAPSLPMPSDLAALASPWRFGWIACRTAAALITVPIAEELAFRGYLMRRLAHRDFDVVSFKEIRWPALALSSIAFGITHGAYGLVACVAGLVYGALAVKTGKIGESVVAHATTNALISTTVLLFDQWQLW